MDVPKQRHSFPAVHLQTVVVPGQPSGTRSDALYDWSRKTVNGVIQVMTNGYRTRHDVALEEDLARSGTMENYFKTQRDLEVEFFRRDFPFYRDLFRKHRTQWVLVVVTKADLYWDKHDEVDAFYNRKDSTFGVALTDLRPFIGDVSVHVLPISAMLETLVLRDHKVRPQFGSEARDGLLFELHRVLQQLGTLS
jgi:hypothetical protein